MGVFNQIKMIWHKRSSSAYIKYLRKKGIHIGEHCIIRAPRHGTDRCITPLISYHR